MKAYIVSGPYVVGNSFGYFGMGLPEGKFAVCEDGEYANGGRGPSTVNGVRYSTLEAAEKALEALASAESAEAAAIESAKAAAEAAEKAERRAAWDRCHPRAESPFVSAFERALRRR